MLPRWQEFVELKSVQSRLWMTLALTALTACGKTSTAPSMPATPAPNTVAGNWRVQVATSQVGVSCPNATLSITIHDTAEFAVGGTLFFRPDTLVLGFTTGCSTSPPFATTTLTDVQGTTYTGHVILWLFPSGALYPQLRLEGNQSDARHMSGILSELNITPWYGSAIGTWSASK